MASTPDPDELAALRREYGDAGLDDPDLTPDPIAMFRRWLHDAVVAGLHEPNAMVVSSAPPDGRPSAPVGAAQGGRRTGLRLLHQLRVPQGRRARRQPVGTAALPLARPAAPGPCRGHGRPASARRRARPTSPPGRAPPSSAPGPPPSPTWSRRETRSQASYDEVEQRFEGRDVPLPAYWGGYRVAPRWWSSGRDVAAGCTTGWSIAARGRAGRRCGSRPDQACGANGTGLTGDPGGWQAMFHLPGFGFPGRPGKPPPINHL